MREIKLQDLKSKTPAELVAFAEEHGVENASTMRKQELMFAILKQLATSLRYSRTSASAWRSTIRRGKIFRHG
jgi:transcription termination factor Rho